MDFVASFSGLVLARVTVRAANDIGDKIYDSGLSVGKELFRRMFKVAQSGDSAALEAVTAEYAAYLEHNPEERQRVVPAILEVAVPDEPLAVLESIVTAMWDAAREVTLDPPVAGMAGCAAFAGSLVDPSHVTVMDVRGRETGNVLPMAELDPEEKEPGLRFEHEYLDFSYTFASGPRMWIVKASGGEERDAVVKELNQLFIGKRSNPLPNQLKDAMARVANRHSGSPDGGQIRQVQAVFADRVDIYYPDYQKDKEMASEPDLVKRVSIQMRRTDVDRLRERELVEFDVKGTAGVRALLTSIEQVNRENNRRRSADREDWADAGRQIGHLEGDKDRAQAPTAEG